MRIVAERELEFHLQLHQKLAIADRICTGCEASDGLEPVKEFSAGGLKNGPHITPSASKLTNLILMRFNCNLRDLTCMDLFKHCILCLWGIM